MRKLLGSDNPHRSTAGVPRSWTLALTILVLAGCGRSGPRMAVAPSPCPPEGTGVPFDSTQMSLLAGRYQLTMITEAISQPGASVTGFLELVVPDSAHATYQPSPLSARRRPLPLIGWTDVALDSLSAGGTADPASRDPATPGIRAIGNFLEVGYAPGVLDGTSTTLMIERRSPEGFSGRWVADHGIEVLIDEKTGRQIYTAGPFCAQRTRAT